MAIKLFFDSSALFAAAYSSTGGARELIRRAIQGDIQIVVSKDVMVETVRNLERKAPQKVDILKQLLDLLELEIIDDPTSTEVRKAEAYVVQKDAVILAAAKKAEVSFFVTLDKKHLLGNPNLSEYIGVIIGTPQEALVFMGEHKIE